MVTVGYNISLGNLGHRYDEALQNAIVSGAAFHLLMTNPHGGINGAGEIQEIGRWKAALPNSTQLLWRTFLPSNGEWLHTLGFTNNKTALSEMLRMSAVAFREHCRQWAEGLAQRWKAEGHLDVIRDDPDNEPKLAGQSKTIYERYAISRVELVKACKRHGVKVAIGAFAVGLPDETMIDNGVFDELLEIVEYISLHEYPSGMIGAGDLESIPYEAMFEPETIWQKLPRKVWAIASIYFLIRRCDRLKLRGDKVGNSNIKIIISETSVHEDIPDAHRVTGHLRGPYGKPECGGDLRGVQAWTKYDEKVFGSNDANLNVALMLEYMLQYAYHVPHIIGVCLFGLNFKWGTGAEGENRCHNYLDVMFDHLRRVLIPAINARILNIPVKAPSAIPDLPADWKWDMQLMKVSSEGVNVRPIWSTDSEVLFVLKGEREIQASENAYPNEGENWVRAIFEDGRVGYFAKQYARIDPVVIEPPSEDDDTKPIDLPDDVDESDIEAAVFKWLDQHANVSQEKTDAAILAWLDANVERIVRAWMDQNAKEIALHISATLSDTPEFFKVGLARLLRQAAMHIEASDSAAVEASH